MKAAVTELPNTRLDAISHYLACPQNQLIWSLALHKSKEEHNPSHFFENPCCSKTGAEHPATGSTAPLWPLHSNISGFCPNCVRRRRWQENASNVTDSCCLRINCIQLVALSAALVKGKQRTWARLAARDTCRQSHWLHWGLQQQSVTVSCCRVTQAVLPKATCLPFPGLPSSRYISLSLPPCAKLDFAESSVCLTTPFLATISARTTCINWIHYATPACPYRTPGYVTPSLAQNPNPQYRDQQLPHPTLPATFPNHGPATPTPNTDQSIGTVSPFPDWGRGGHRSIGPAWVLAAARHSARTPQCPKARPAVRV